MGTRERETQEGIRGKASMIKIMRERESGTGTARGGVPTTQPLREWCDSKNSTKKGSTHPTQAEKLTPT